MTKTYRVVFQGLVKDEASFREGMEGLGVSPEVVDRVLRNAPVGMKQGLTLGEARRYAEAVQEAGARVAIQEHGWIEEEAPRRDEPSIPSLGAFTMCPECGLKQMRKPSCERCGCSLKTSKFKT